MNVRSSVGTIDITGIEAGADGESIWLFANDGRVWLERLDARSDPANQILMPGSIQIQQYEMVQLVYSATIQKWIVMDN